jgi:outer membrane protein
MRNRRIIVPGIALLLSHFAIPAMAQQTQQTQQTPQRYEFSVKQAVDFAMKNSAQVKNALIDISVQEQTNRELTGAAYPQISGNIDMTYFPKVPVQSFPNFIAQGTYAVLQEEGVKNGSGSPIVSPTDFGIIQAQFGTKYTGSAGISLNQLLFDGQVFVGLQARSTAIDLARSIAEVTQEQIKANVYKIYYQMLVGRRLIQTVDANIDRVEKLLNDTREIFKQGLAEKLDVDRLEVTITNLRTDKVKVINQLDAGLLGLKFLMGMPLKDELILTDSISDDNLKRDILDTTFAYTDRKEYQQIGFAEKLREYNVKRYKLSKIPTLSLNGTYSKNAQRNRFNFFDWDNPWYTTALVGVRVNVPIFQGFSQNSRIKRAEYELEQTKNLRSNLELQIDNEVETSRINLRSALLTVDFQRKNMTLAESVYNTSVKKYEQGLGSNLEITTANTELRTAQSNYYQSLYDAIIAKIDYFKATGKL